MSRNFRARLPQKLDEQLMELCEATRLPTATAIKRCVEYVLAHPEAWEIFQRSSLVDTRSPEAVAAYERYEKALEAFDLTAIAREQGLV